MSSEHAQNAVDMSGTLLVSQHIPADHEACVLTIAIPAYKHAHYIDECLSSLLTSQHLKRMEIIVIDDCSPDETAMRAIHNLERSGACFRVYRNKSNQGLSYGLNFLLSVARGAYLVVCASDDQILGPSLDQLIVKIMASDGPKSFEICAADYFDDRQGSVYDNARLSHLAADTQAFCRWLSTEIPKPLLLQSTLFNSAFLKRLDPWRDQLILDDWPTFLRASQLAQAEHLPITFTPEIVLTRYRVHLGGLHANADRQRRACLQVVEQVIPAAFRPRARANVLSEFTIADLARGEYKQAWRGYVEAVASYPRPGTVFRAPIFALLGVFRRLGRKARRIW